MSDEREGIDQELALKFDAQPDTGQLMALTKGDVALLINSLAELHESMAALQAAPILTGRDPDGLMVSSGNHARESYNLFAVLANRWMGRFVDKVEK